MVRSIIKLNCRALCEWQSQGSAASLEALHLQPCRSLPTTLLICMYFPLPEVCNLVGVTSRLSICVDGEWDSCATAYHNASYHIVLDVDPITA